MLKELVEKEMNSVEEILRMNKRDFPFANHFNKVKKNLEALNNIADDIMSLFAQMQTISRGR